MTYGNKKNPGEKKDFNKEASTWDENPSRIELAKCIVNAILKQVPLTKDMAILDYGAGTGLVTLGLQPHVKSIVAADSSTGMLEVLDKKILSGSLSNVSTMVIDLESGLSSGMKFDAIVSSMVLHHVEDVPGLISKLCDMLRPGGYISLADLDPDDGQFHNEPVGVLHQGFNRKYMADLFAQNTLSEITLTTACKIKKEVRKKAEREFTIFLASGKKI